VPAGYTPSRVWPVILAFDAGGRGRVPVERYQAAAERYGYIVVGSNNSRNGSTEIPKILAALTRDVSERLAVDPRRVYLAGMSGGARVALQVALASKRGRRRHRVERRVPGQQGPQEPAVSHLCHRRNRGFQSSRDAEAGYRAHLPHRLAIFNGGHVWLPSELAVEAIEWMELQAMKTGLKPKDDGEIDRIVLVAQCGPGKGDGRSQDVPRVTCAGR
jgi:hypothetical protein